MKGKLLSLTCSCGGKMKKAFVPVEFFGIDFGVREAEVCTKCNAEYLDEKLMEKIEKEIKKKGLFGLESKVKVTKSGNSLVIRIPPEIAKFTGLKYESLLRIFPVGKKRIEIEAL
ncbi:MAG: hypothetical protein ABIE23_02245 [archaeon]